MSVISETDKKSAFVSSVFDSRDQLDLPIPAAWKDSAAAALATLNFPTSKTETWKYTRTGRISNRSFAFSPDASTIDLKQFLIPEADACRLVFVNGFFRKELSNILPQPGLSLKSATEASEEELDVLGLSEHDIFTALNAGAFNGGVVLRASKGHEIAQPVHLVFLSTADDCISQPRNAIIVERSAALSIVASYGSVGSGVSFTNAVTEVRIEENAGLAWVSIQAESDEAIQINSMEAAQERNSRLSITTITADGGLVRNNIHVSINGEGCETNLYGTYMPCRKQHTDNRTVIDHRVANCQSNELYKGLLTDEGTGVFNGKVFVRQDAQKTNAFQKNANILLSDTASMNSKPELEIYADDVKCSHGSTTGRLDEEALFYLMSRGMSRQSARGLLASAFVADIVSHIQSDPVKQKVREILTRRKGLTFE